MFQNILSIPYKERYSLFLKSSDLLESYQRNKSGLKYYNSNASKQEIEEIEKQFGKLKEYSSNYFTEACVSLHPYSSYKYRHDPFFVLYMCSNHYFSEDIVTDEETKQSWIYDVYKKEIVEFKTKYGNFNILKKILEIFRENYEGFTIINQNILKKEIEDLENYNIYDANLKKIIINNNNEIPSGLYAKSVERIRNEESGNLNILNGYYKTGDPRSLFKSELSKSISALCRSLPPLNIINSSIEILNNIPDVNNPKRKEYFYYNIQKNNAFNTLLKYYTEYLELIYKVDYYYSGDEYKKKLNIFGENKDDVISLIKEKLTIDEINTIIYGKYNESNAYPFEYESNPNYAYNVEFLVGLRKIRLVAQGELVDEKTALDFFNNYASKHNTSGNVSHMSHVYEIFENSIGFSPEISNYFKEKARSFKTISSKKGQEIFNDGINNNKIITTRLSNYPNVNKSLDSIIKDFINTNSYIANDEGKIKNALESTPIYIVDKTWLKNEMEKNGIDRLFEEIGVDDAKGIFASYLETINEGKPFVIIYKDNDYDNALVQKDEFEAVKDVFGIEGEQYGQVITHELIHRLQYLGIEGGRRLLTNQNFSQDYGDPWLEKPEEIEAIVYGNIPYIYNLILQRIDYLFESGDKSLIDTLIEKLMEETKRIESYQIDKIYDNIPQDSKQEIIIKNSEDMKYEEETLKEYIKNSIYDIDIQRLNEEDKQTYVKEISDNLLQIVMTKWFSQFKVDYAAGLFFSDDAMAEKMALKIRNNFELARREELSKMKPEEINNFTNELIDDPYQTYGRESLQRLVRNFPKNEKDLFNKLKEEPIYIEVMERIAYNLNDKFNPEITGNEEDKHKYKVWFFDNGELKIPYSLDGLLNYIDSVDNIIRLHDNKDKFKELIKKYIDERDKFKQVETYLQNSPQKETYESDELHELVDLLVDMYSNYGSGWIWVAKKWDNIVKISKIKKEFLNTKWAADFY